MVENHKIVAIGPDGNMIEIPAYFCPKCEQYVPVVEDCSNCGGPHTHIYTKDEHEKNLVHYVYECNGCPPGKRKAKKSLYKPTIS